MKRILGLILMGIGLTCIGYSQVSAPPDVYAKWIATNVTITNTVTEQNISLPLPTSGITKYSFHYVYIFFSGSTCSVNALDVNTTGTLLGTFPNTTTNGQIPIGGLLTNAFSTPSQVTPGSKLPILVLKGNGAVNSLSGNLHLVTAAGIDWTGCTLNILYKGTTNEEEGNIARGVFAPSDVSVTLGTPSSTGVINTNVDLYRFILDPPGKTGYKAGFAVDNITFCVLPKAADLTYRGTKPVSIQVIQGSVFTNGSNILAVSSITNSCAVIEIGSIANVTLRPIDHLYIDAYVDHATGYPSTGFGELVATMHGHVIY
jgi:hypothetical protein